MENQDQISFRHVFLLRHHSPRPGPFACAKKTRLHLKHTTEPRRCDKKTDVCAENGAEKNGNIHHLGK